MMSSSRKLGGSMALKHVRCDPRASTVPELPCPRAPARPAPPPSRSVALTRAPARRRRTLDHPPEDQPNTPSKSKLLPQRSLRFYALLIALALVSGFLAFQREFAGGAACSAGGRPTAEWGRRRRRRGLARAQGPEHLLGGQLIGLLTHLLRRGPRSAKSPPRAPPRSFQSREHPPGWCAAQGPRDDGGGCRLSNSNLRRLFGVGSLASPLRPVEAPILGAAPESRTGARAPPAEVGVC